MADVAAMPVEYTAAVHSMEIGPVRMGMVNPRILTGMAGSMSHVHGVGPNRAA